MQLGRIADHVARARQGGCTVVAGGEILESASMQGGWFYAPTLVEAADPQDPIGRRRCSAQFDEALALANGKDYALVAGLHARDLAKAHRFAREVVAGQVYINELFPGGSRRRSAGTGRRDLGGRRGWKG